MSVNILIVVRTHYTVHTGLANNRQQLEPFVMTLPD